jgi:hypothetical protein
MISSNPPARKFRASLFLCFVCALVVIGAFAPARAADAAAPAATTAPAAATATTPRPQLPIDFKDFAADYKPGQLYPEWYNVEIAILETTLKPVEGQINGYFGEKDWPEALAVIFKPVSLMCVVGTKTRYDNVMTFTVDKAGNPLGYELPLGQIIYFLARSTTANGIYFSVHLYDCTDLKWVANPEKPGTFVPVTQATIVSRDVLSKPNTYTYFLLSQHMDTVRPDSPVKPNMVYKYLVVHIHAIEQQTEPAPSGIMLQPGGPGSAPGS